MAGESPFTNEDGDAFLQYDRDSQSDEDASQQLDFAVPEFEIGGIATTNMLEQLPPAQFPTAQPWSTSLPSGPVTVPPEARRKDVQKAPEFCPNRDSPHNGLLRRHAPAKASTSVWLYGEPSFVSPKNHKYAMRLYPAAFHYVSGLLCSGDYCVYRQARGDPDTRCVFGGVLDQPLTRHIHQTALLLNLDGGYMQEAPLSKVHMDPSYKQPAQQAAPLVWSTCQTSMRTRLSVLEQSYTGLVRACDSKPTRPVPAASAVVDRLRSAQTLPPPQQPPPPPLPKKNIKRKKVDAGPLPDHTLVLIDGGAHKGESGYIETSTVTRGLVRVQTVLDSGFGDVVQVRPASVIIHPEPTALQSLIDAAISAGQSPIPSTTPKRQATIAHLPDHFRTPTDSRSVHSNSSGLLDDVTTTSTRALAGAMAEVAARSFEEGVKARSRSRAIPPSSQFSFPPATFVPPLAAAVDSGSLLNQAYQQHYLQQLVSGQLASLQARNSGFYI